MAHGKSVIYIDTSDAEKKLRAIGSVLSPERAAKVNYRVLKRTGTHTKTIVAKDVPKHYHIKQKEVKADIRAPIVHFGGNTTCKVPIEGKRRTVGGSVPARGGRRGWNVQAGKRYKIHAHVLKTGWSKLPEEMEKMGGNPPFRNLSAPRLNNAAFTRKGDDRFPIAPIKTVAVPQMPMNRAQDDVQEDIVDYMKRRAEHEYNYEISKAMKGL